MAWRRHPQPTSTGHPTTTRVAHRPEGERWLFPQISQGRLWVPSSCQSCGMPSVVTARCFEWFQPSQDDPGRMPISVSTSVGNLDQHQFMPVVECRKLMGTEHRAWHYVLAGGFKAP